MEAKMRNANGPATRQHDGASQAYVPVNTALAPDEVRCGLLSEDTPPLFIERVSPRLAVLGAFVEWARANRSTLDALIIAHGGILLRGFPVSTAADFDAFSDVFPTYAAGYVGGASPRATVAGKVMESTRMASDLSIAIHSEMNYLRDFPPRIAFYCKTAAARGGETIIGDLRKISRNIPASVIDKLQRLRVRNVRNYAPASENLVAASYNLDLIPWNVSFETSSKDKVESICGAMGMEAIWNADGSLTVVNLVEALVRHPKTGQTIYRGIVHTGGRIPPSAISRRVLRFTAKRLPPVAVKQLSAILERFRAQELLKKQALPTGYTLGDGSTLTEEERTAVRAAIDDATIMWPWRDGDIMILDNLEIGHGRNPYEGNREVFVTLLDS
jgi:alpha-ketoglutarate-dependent taurine dioxygenase